MKIRLLLALVGLALGFTVLAFAQQKDVAEPQIRQQLDALGQKYDEAFNNGDPAALAANFTEDAVLVNDTGPVYGREAIEKYYADLFQKVHLSNWLTTVDQNAPHAIGTAGNEMWEPEGGVGLFKGRTSVLYTQRATFHRFLFVRAMFGRGGCRCRT